MHAFLETLASGAASGAGQRGGEEWEGWFQLPYVKDPAAHPAFRVYFTKEWASRLVVSIHNLLTTAFENLPLPALLASALRTRDAATRETTALRAQVRPRPAMRATPLRAPRHAYHATPRDWEGSGLR